jgi:hypothetical protein
MRRSVAIALFATACGGAGMTAYKPFEQKTKHSPEALFQASTHALEAMDYQIRTRDPTTFTIETREREIAYSSVPRLSYKYTLKIVTANGTLRITSTCKQNSAMKRQEFDDCGDERPSRVLADQEDFVKDTLKRAKKLE